MSLNFNTCFDIDTMEGALLHVIAICGGITAAAANDFCVKYGANRGKKIPEHYAENTLLKRLRENGRIYKTKQNIYTLNPITKVKRETLDCFWVFLEHMEGVDLISLSGGGSSAFKLSYMKNNRYYHIIACNGAGEREMAIAANHENEWQNRARPKGTPDIELRYFFVFPTKEAMAKPHILMRSPTMYCTVTYSNSAYPYVTFEPQPEQFNG